MALLTGENTCVRSEVKMKIDNLHNEIIRLHNLKELLKYSNCKDKESRIIETDKLIAKLEERIKIMHDTISWK